MSFKMYLTTFETEEIIMSYTHLSYLQANIEEKSLAVIRR